MAYIGRDTDKISNVEVLDNITFDGSSSYTLQKGGSNFTPSSANTLLLSIDGVVQAGNFTVSGSTIDFGTAVAGTSTCDFILHYGVGLITVPADGSVTSAKLASGVGGVAGITSSADATAITIDSSENVGVGETSPLGKLHVKSADTGAGSVSGNANELVIENTGEVGITLQTDNSGTGNLYFGDIANGSVGRVSYSHADDSMRFNVNGSQVLYIKNDGKIGTGSSSGTLELEGGATYPGARIALSGGLASTDPGTFKFFTDDGTDTNPAERMRITSDGNVNVGSEGTAGTAVGLNVHNHGWSTMATFKTGTSTNAQYIQFINSNGTVGSINMSGSSTSYNTSSDYRLKENVVEIENATARLKQLQPKRFNFIADADTTVDGFLAHEVSSVVPEAISGTHNEVQVWQDGEELPDGVSVGDNKLDDDGNTIPVYQGIDQSKLVPLLVKTIQELEARITTLENA